MKKRMITQDIITLYDGDFDGPIDDVIRYIVNLKDSYSRTYENLRIEFDHGCDGGDLLILLRGERPENEKEEKKRLKQEEALQKMKEKQKAGRKKLYLELKKEFDNEDVAK